MQKELIRYTEEQKELIRSNLRKILIFYGAIPGQYNWTCIADRHKNPKDDLSLKGNVCKCHCGLGGDSFSVIAEIEGYNIKKDFPQIIKRGLEIIGSNVTPIKYRCYDKNIGHGQEKKEPKHDLTKIILQNFKNSKSYVYFKKRNIRNLELMKKYRIFIENPVKVFPKDLLPKIYNIWAYQNIIPVWEDQKVVNVILRRDDYLSKKNKKIMNLKGLDLKIWNAGYIRHSKFKDKLFLTEGIFDALSIESIGGKGIALNSIVMVSKLLIIIKEFIDQLKENQVKFFICFDNDERKDPDKPTNSEKAKDKLDSELRKLGLKSFIIKLNNYKDLNEFYNKEKNNFTEKIKRIVGD